MNTKVNSFFSKFRIKTFKKGQTIINPESIITEAYFIKSGFVKAYVISPEGIETTIHLFSTSSYFPMMSIISDLPNRFYYEALTQVKIYLAPKEKVRNFLKENNDVLLDLTIRLLKGLDGLSLRIEQLSSAQASIRLVSVLVFLARHFGEKQDGRLLITEIFSHREIASLAGLARETTSREWRKLEKKGYVSTKNRYLIINDLQNLTKELNNEH